MTPEQYQRINELLTAIAKELDLVEDIEETPEAEATATIKKLETILAILQTSPDHTRNS